MAKYKKLSTNSVFGKFRNNVPSNNIKPSAPPDTEMQNDYSDDFQNNSIPKAPDISEMQYDVPEEDQISIDEGNDEPNAPLIDDDIEDEIDYAEYAEHFRVMPPANFSPHVDINHAKEEKILAKNFAKNPNSTTLDDIFTLARMLMREVPSRSRIKTHSMDMDRLTVYQTNIKEQFVNAIATFSGHPKHTYLNSKGFKEYKETYSRMQKLSKASSLTEMQRMELDVLRTYHPLIEQLTKTGQDLFKDWHKKDYANEIYDNLKLSLNHLVKAEEPLFRSLNEIEAHKGKNNNSAMSNKKKDVAILFTDGINELFPKSSLHEKFRALFKEPPSNENKSIKNFINKLKR